MPVTKWDEVNVTSSLSGEFRLLRIAGADGLFFITVILDCSNCYTYLGLHFYKQEEMPYQSPGSETLKALETAPNMYLILSPDLFILTASDLYLEATQNKREWIAGKHIFEAFPDNPALPDADGGTEYQRLAARSFENKEAASYAHTTL